MKQLHIHTAIGFIACLLSFSAVLAACSSGDEQEQNTDGRQLRQLTIRDVPITRATLIDNTNTLGASWDAGDKATYFNLSTFDVSTIDWGLLEASSSKSTSSFTGSVLCKEGDCLALFYPYQQLPLQGDNRGKFTINLAGQKGSLDDIAKRFHYVYGVATVTSVADGTANAGIAAMKSLLAVCKFTFNDGENVIPVKTLAISYYDKAYNSKENYPQTALVTPLAASEDVIAVPEDQEYWEQPLTITLGEETSDGVYVSLLPYDAFEYLHFAVTGSEGTYVGTAKANLKAGKYYPVALKLTKQ